MMVRIGMLLMVMGIASFMAFSLIGSTLNEQGFLQEPFALLPLGYLLLLAGAGLVLFGLVRSRRRPRPSQPD
jgi:Na+/H+-dicarboxylate symporter